MKTNGARHPAQSQNKKIRSFQIDLKRLEEAADRMRAQMLEYIKRSAS